MEKILELIKSSSEKGITVEELMKNSHSTKSMVYSTILTLRKKKNYPIKTVSNRYFLFPTITNKAEKPLPMGKELQNMLFPVSSSDSITLESKELKSEQKIKMLMEANELPPALKEDYLEMIQKSAFYHQCAKAILCSNKLKEELRAELSMYKNVRK
jgi:hypothetical protein